MVSELLQCINKNEKEMKTVLIVISFSFLCFISFTQNGGYDGKRFAITYNPGCSFSNILFTYPQTYFHHKLEVGASLFNFCQLNLNAETVNSFRSYGEDGYLTDKTFGGSILFFKTYKGYYSPIGTYIGVGVNKGKEETHKQYYIDYNAPAPTTFITKSKITVISIYTGQNYIVYDCFLLGFGVQWGWIQQQNAISLHYFAKPHFKLGVIF